MLPALEAVIASTSSLSVRSIDWGRQAPCELPNPLDRSELRALLDDRKPIAAAVGILLRHPLDTHFTEDFDTAVSAVISVSQNRRKTMRTELRWLSRGAFVSLAVVGAMMFGLRVAHGHDRQHVSWDIINLAFTTPPTVTAGGAAFATTKNPTSLKIKLTGSGTFVARSGGGSSRAVTGGGTWETFSGCPSACVSTASGEYWVTRLVSWEFANLQLPVLNDLIGQNAANGTAVFQIRYSDGSKGTLGIGCHGPGAPDGIVEGVIATKDFVTYWDAAVPVGGVNENRTVFHIE